MPGREPAGHNGGDMEKMIWSDEFSTGIQVIDRQHQHIVGYINRLCDAHSGAVPRDEIRHIFDDLVDYTLTHFTFEETLLANGNPRSLRTHKQTHEVFSDKVRTLRSQFHKQGGMSLELSRLLVSWLFDHILHDDKRDITVIGSRLAPGV
jgi:hemerythrin